MDQAIGIVAVVLLGLAAGVLSRSLPVGIAASMMFFPIDNAATFILLLLQRFLHQDIWAQITAYLLGPNLNVMLHAIEPDHTARAAFAVPAVDVSSTHVLLVTLAWSLVLLAAAVVPGWLRDVLE